MSTLHIITALFGFTMVAAWLLMKFYRRKLNELYFDEEVVEKYRSENLSMTTAILSGAALVLTSLFWLANFSIFEPELKIWIVEPWVQEDVYDLDMGNGTVEEILTLSGSSIAIVLVRFDISQSSLHAILAGAESTPVVGSRVSKKSVRYMHYLRDEGYEDYNSSSFTFVRILADSIVAGNPD